MSHPDFWTKPAKENQENQVASRGDWFGAAIAVLATGIGFFSFMVSLKMNYGTFLSRPTPQESAVDRVCLSVGFIGVAVIGLVFLICLARSADPHGAGKGRSPGRVVALTIAAAFLTFAGVWGWAAALSYIADDPIRIMNAAYAKDPLGVVVPEGATLDRTSASEYGLDRDFIFRGAGSRARFDATLPELRRLAVASGWSIQESTVPSATGFHASKIFTFPELCKDEQDNITADCSEGNSGLVISTPLAVFLPSGHERIGETEEITVLRISIGSKTPS